MDKFQIWRTSIRIKRHQLELPSLQLAKEMAIPYHDHVLQDFCSKKSKFQNSDYATF
jgi:hypothetical protein